MRSAVIFSFVAPALISTVAAVPYKHGDQYQNNDQYQHGKSCEYPYTVTVTTTYTPPAETRWITGVPAPSSESKWITGVPAPSSTFDGYITGVPAPSSTFDGYITGVPAPSSTCNESITGVPAPSDTSAPIPEPSSSLPPVETSSGTSVIPLPTPIKGCRPPSWNHNGRSPTTGKLRAALIFVDFDDAPANSSVEDHYASIATAPTEFFKTISYGKLELELVPVLDKFYRMPALSSSYNYSRDLTTEMHLKYINDALAAVGPSVSFKNIDALYVLPPKFANEIPGSTSTGSDVTALDGSVINISITFGQDLYFSWGPKTVNHETGHAMGLPDLYPSTGNVWDYVGGYDIMGLISGQSPDYFAWHKWQLDWIVDGQVDCVTTPGTSTHRVGPVEIEGLTAKAIAIPITETNYLMVEVRSNLGVDVDACGTGVLLYTTETTAAPGTGPVRVIDTKPNSGNVGCAAQNGGELNDAPLKNGEQWDTKLGVVVTVLAQDGEDYIIKITRSI